MTCTHPDAKNVGHHTVARAGTGKIIDQSLGSAADEVDPLVRTLVMCDGEEREWVCGYVVGGWRKTRYARDTMTMVH